MKMLKKLTGAFCEKRHYRAALSLLISVLSLSVVAPAMAQPKAIDFQRTVVADRMDLPLEFEISKDGRAFVASKCGKLYAWKLEGGTPMETAIVPNVRCVWEDGLLGVALDPNFVTNNFIYFQYTSPGSLTRVSRFTVNANNSLDLTSEKILLQWKTGDEAHGHMGGSLKFDTAGNLLITTGDNKAAGGYFQPAAQGTSGNTNDMRGKVLRIKPTAAGGYTIPAGNLFPADATHKAEIYAMGFRNPFRINIDPLTNYYYLGDIGPDSSTDSAEGPGGIDEINELRVAGNYGWPYIIGPNRPYAGFSPTNIVNNATDNTGAKNLPNSIGSLWTIRHQATMAGPVYRHNPAITNEFKLPEYYNGKLIFWDFNSSKFFTLDVGTANPTAVEMPLNTTGFQGAIDAELDPRTHQLYVLQWGTGCCGKEPYGNGMLYRFDYIGGRAQGTNLAIGGTATSTTTAGGNLAAYAIDGNPATRWESTAADPQTLTIQLAKTATIGSIVLTWEAAYSSQYRIEGFNGTSWVTLITENNGSGGVKLHLIDSATKYSQIRIVGLARGTAYGHSLFEVEVLEGDAEPDPLTQYAYLNMPKTLDANFTGVPRLLSQTGAFSNTATLTPSVNMLPFTPNSQLWSDRANKFRWVSIPKDTKINWSAKENWTFPQGTVAVKHFELPINANNPAQVKRLETRLIVMKADGKVYGVTYKWRADNSDADLLLTGAQENVQITNANGTTSTQTWSYPSPTECIDCHNAASSQILGVNTRQLNSNLNYGGTIGTKNQLIHWRSLNLFNSTFTDAQVTGFDKMVGLSDTSATVENRIKSYLDANCAHCHGTGNGGSQWDARYNTPLADMKIVNNATTGIRNYQTYYGLTNAQVVAAGKPQESVLYIRDKSVNPDDRMPPIGRNLEHTEYITLLGQWISSLSTVVTPTQPKLLSTGKPVTASSTEAAYVPGNVVDANLGTRWGSAFTDTEWIQIDLQATYKIDEIVLAWEAAYGSNYTIAGSTNGTTWTTLVTKTNGTGGVEVHENLTGSYRYIRLNGTKRGSPWGYSLFEFEVWGDSGTTTPVASILSPAAGQQITAGTPIDLQVSVSDSAWYTSGGTYRYTLDTNAPVTVNNVNPVRLPTLAAGAHSVTVQLYNSSGAAVGTARTTNFTVNGAPQTPVLISQGKTATSSAVEGNMTAANAFDGNMGTRWSSAHSDNQYIQIDLGERMSIKQIVLEWEAAYGTGYYIQVSDNATAWTEIYRTTTGNGGNDTLTVDGTGRYVRLTGTARATAWGYSLFEFRVYGNPVTTNPDPVTPTISITTPTAGQQFAQGAAVSLQVGISDSAWYSAGNGYRYSVDGAAAVRVNNATAVNLGVLASGNHTVQVSLVNAQNAVVGTPASVSFSVSATPGVPQISITTPTAGQQFAQGAAVSLQVGISDSAWYSAGNGYRYSVDGGAAVRVNNATAVNLGVLAGGNHTVQVNLVNAQNTVVGTAASVSFTVSTGPSNPNVPAPAKLTPVTATASTSLASGLPSYAFDGNLATRWESAHADPQYIQYDFGRSMYFSRVALHWEAAYARAYTVDVSENGTTWTPVYTTTAGTGGVTNIALDGQRGRYIRMNGTQRATGYGYSLFEFEAYGVPADANLPMISISTPSEGQSLANTANASLQVSITDTSWIANGGSYNYSLDGKPAVRVTNLNAVNLGVLPTGGHTLRVSLVNSSGAEVSVPRTRNFKVNCGTSCPNVLVFSKTSGFRHGSIEAGIAMVRAIGTAHGYTITATENADVFTTANLAQYSTIVFMNTTGDIFTTAQETAFRTYIENGGGFVGTHSAADTEHGWAWYTGTLFAGAEFIHHGDGIPMARVRIEKTDNALVNHIGAEWMIGDEWYFWKSNPRGVGNVEVLGNLDRSSYTSNYPVADHPIIFTNRVGTGKMFYTAIGHVDANFSDPKMVEMIRKAIEWTSAD